MIALLIIIAAGGTLAWLHATGRNQLQLGGGREQGEPPQEGDKRE